MSFVKTTLKWIIACKINKKTNYFSFYEIKIWKLIGN